MKIFLDDIRNPPDSSWTVVRNAFDAISLIIMGGVEFISFDHDLGLAMTGADVAKFIEERAYLNHIQPPNYSIHSANPVGARNIQAAMSSANREWHKWVRKQEKSNLI